jgi:hypothetical protein
MEYRDNLFRGIQISGKIQKEKMVLFKKSLRKVRKKDFVNVFMLNERCTTKCNGSRCSRGSKESILNG